MLLLERVLDLLFFPCLLLPLLEVTLLHKSYFRANGGIIRVLFTENRNIARNSLDIPVEDDPIYRGVKHLLDTVQLPRPDVWVGDS